MKIKLGIKCEQNINKIKLKIQNKDNNEEIK